MTNTEFPKDSGILATSSPFESCALAAFPPSKTCVNRAVLLLLYNPSDSPLTISTTDGSSGWAVAASDGIARFVVPNGTIIPARAHFLGANNSASSGYSLGACATPDATYTLNIPSALSGEGNVSCGIALFRTSNPANFNYTFRADAAGPINAETNPLYREGAGHAQMGFAQDEQSVHRWEYLGQPLDTDNNAVDLNTLIADSNAGGAASPQNLASPININANLPAALLDPGVAATASPNRQRDFAPVTYPGRQVDGRQGTVTIRRTFTNNTGGAITKLRFRIAGLRFISGLDDAVAATGTADARVVSSTDASVPVSGGGSVLVRGLTLEEPPSQPRLGGVNSSLVVPSITAGTPLAAGQTISVSFVVAFSNSGEIRLRVNAEATSCPGRT